MNCISWWNILLCRRKEDLNNTCKVFYVYKSIRNEVECWDFKIIIRIWLFLYDNFEIPKDLLLLVLDRNATLEFFSTHCTLKERSLIFDAQPLSHSFKIKNLSCLKHVTWLEIWDLNSVLRFDFLILNSVLGLIFWSSIQFYIDISALRIRIWAAWKMLHDLGFETTLSSLNSVIRLRFLFIHSNCINYVLMTSLEDW